MIVLSSEDVTVVVATKVLLGRELSYKLLAVST